VSVGIPCGGGGGAIIGAMAGSPKVGVGVLVSSTAGNNSS